MIYIVEGEKDVHAIGRAGGIATTNPGGAGKWRDEYNKSLRGARVVIVADRDDAGRKHARSIFKALTGVAESIVIVEPAVGKDTSDHLSAGLGLNDFLPIEGGDRSLSPAASDRGDSRGAGLKHLMCSICTTGKEFRFPVAGALARRYRSGHGPCEAPGSDAASPPGGVVTISDLIHDLLERWEHELDLLRRHGAIGPAQTKAACLEELRVWWRQVMLEELSLEEATAYSGLAYDTIRKKLADGELPNAGQKGRPRVRRAYLPMKPPGPPVDLEDLDQIAGSILAARGK